MPQNTQSTNLVADFRYAVSVFLNFIFDVNHMHIYRPYSRYAYMFKYCAFFPLFMLSSKYVEGAEKWVSFHFLGFKICCFMFYGEKKGCQEQKRLTDLCQSRLLKTDDLNCS